MNEELVQFYDGPAVEEIWSWNFERLENVHDYIQWLFPTARLSHYHPAAPLLDEETVALFRRMPPLRERLLRSWRTMLAFYGLRAAAGPLVEKAESFGERFPAWSGPLNHNLLRITRILESLRLLGCEKESEAFYTCLRELWLEFPGRLPRRTLDYWADAAGLEREPPPRGWRKVREVFGL